MKDKTRNNFKQVSAYMRYKGIVSPCNDVSAERQTIRIYNVKIS